VTVIRYSIVIPTIGRPSLDRLLAGLARVAGRGPAPEQVVLVDDRPFDGSNQLPLAIPAIPWPVRVVRSGGRGPAAARNAGWRSAASPWIAFLDDDVEVGADWAECLAADIRLATATVGGIQAQLVVPLPDRRRPTDWERNTAALQDAAWITADMAYRRAALESVHGFDERFPRAYREDADLALRVQRAGWRLTRGSRLTTHPVRPADDRVSIRMQAGAADDALLRALHGRDWRSAAATGRGRFPWHVATVTAAAGAATAALCRRPATAVALGAGWFLLTADFLRRRLLPGPRPGDEVWPAEFRRMATTSAVIPFAAVRHRLAGLARHRLSAPAWPVPIAAVLFDRDGTLVHDVPYNGDPEKVRVVGGARQVLDELRSAGIRVGVISNQSGIARGMLTAGDVAAVNRRIEHELGPFDVWEICPHAPDDGCVCRKPMGGMVLRAAAALGVAPFECAVIGDIEADVLAARAAGATGVLVPTPVTLAAEIDRAELVATSLQTAVAAALAVRSGAGFAITARPAEREAA
jgi:HAD superfamily hydrolase (TIGR01662 family)